MAFAILCLAVLAAAGCASGRAASGEPAAHQVLPSSRHHQSARAALMKGNIEKASLEVKLALGDDPLDAKSHFLFGCLLEIKGDHDQAVVAFQRALTLDSTDPATLYNLGTMLMGRGEAVAACHLLENAVLTRPNHVPSWNNLAKAYYLAGLPELTVAAYEEALRLDPSNVAALTSLQFLAEAAGLPDAAAAYRRRLRALPSSRPAKPAITAGDQSAGRPIWPIATTAGATSSAAVALPANLASEQGTRDDPEVNNLRELLRNLPHVTAERRGGRLTLTGWTSSAKERAVLDRILGNPSAAQDKKAGRDSTQPLEILDLTSDDTGDPHRLLEIDAVIFVLSVIDSESEGFNFLESIDLNFNYFASDHHRDGTGYAAPPDVTGSVQGLAQQGWIFEASVDYIVNIANATENRVAVLARPHLTTVSGSPAKFLAGGELVYRVSGINSGDIKPYPFGTTLTITPTLLRTPAQDGTPRVRVVVDAGRTSVQSLFYADPDKPTAFDKINVTSEAVLTLGQTLILSGLNQRESRSGREGVPVLMDIPVLKYFFSRRTTLDSNAAVMILLTPRDPAFQDERNQKDAAQFLEKRRAYLQARRGTPEDMRRFQERYPDWHQLAPSRFATHFFLLQNSELYRAASGQELTSEDVNLELLGPDPKKK